MARFEMLCNKLIMSGSISSLGGPIEDTGTEVDVADISASYSASANSSLTDFSNCS